MVGLAPYAARMGKVIAMTQRIWNGAWGLVDDYPRETQWTCGGVTFALTITVLVLIGAF